MSELAHHRLPAAAANAVPSILSNLEVWLIIAIPLVLSLWDDSWLFTLTGYLDPWYNLGYFLHYSDPSFLNSYYKIARLSWIIPGYITFSIFTPLIANYVLHMGCLIGASLLLFASLKLIVSRSIAFLTAAMLVTYVQFHGPGGWDYQLTSSNFYYLATFYLLTRAAVSGCDINRHLFAAGTAYGACLHSNVICANMAPILAAHFTVLAHIYGVQAISLRTSLRNIAIFGLGVFLLTLVLGTINAAIGRDFFFFNTLLQLVTKFVGSPETTQTAWWQPWSSRWFLTPTSAAYLALPFTILVAGLAALVHVITKHRMAANSVAVLLVGQYIFIAILWLFWQSVGHTALQPDYFLSPIIPVLFCAIAGLYALGLEHSEKPIDSPRFIVILIAFAVALPLASNLFHLAHRIPYSALLYLTLAAVATIAIYVASRSHWLIAGAAVIFGLFNAGGARETSRLQNYSNAHVCTSPKADYVALLRAHTMLTSYKANVSNVYVWWDKDERLTAGGCTMGLTNLSLSLTSFGSNYLTSPWGGMPAASDISDEALKILPTAAFIAIVTADPANVERIRTRLSQGGIQTAFAGKQRLKILGFQFDLTILMKEGT